MGKENRLYSISLGVASLQGGLVGVATALSPATCRPFQVFSPSFFVGLGLIDDLHNTLQQRHPKPHPIRQLLLGGQLSREQLCWWAKNQFHEFRNIHRFFGVRYQKWPIPELRRMLLENMVEEEGEDLFGGKYGSHRDLWVQF